MNFNLAWEWTQLNEYHTTKANKEQMEQGKTMKIMFILPNWILKLYIWLLSGKIIFPYMLKGFHIALRQITGFFFYG